MTELHRLDQWLVALQMVSSRQRAEVLIKEGGVAVNGQVVKRPGKKFDETADISLLKDPMRWVSRGALKLIAALDRFEVYPRGKRCLDVGASTGGFTEVLLSRDASFVVALDTGSGQLAESLRVHPRVRNLENVNIRHADTDSVGQKVDLVVIDVSFISLRLVLPEVKKFMTPNAEVVALVKPQFEVGKDQIGKNGIVRNVTAREQALIDIRRTAESLGFHVAGQIDSPITGGDGNHEYLIHLK
jgi:23S rRNA (cytidine1920-2'-O)/16S rRNA (cytidine1409-2'-O)-methyltransferase